MDMSLSTGPAAAEAGPGPSGGEGAVHQYLRFALGREMHAVRIDVVREILEVSQMTPLPLMPEFVRGVMNLRGAVVPVIDLGARLGLDVTTIGRRTCVVLVDVAAGEGRQTMGVLVDAVYEVFGADAADAEPVPRLGTRIRPEFIRSIVRVRDEVTPELDLGAVLEQGALVELIARHTAAH